MVVSVLFVIVRAVSSVVKAAMIATGKCTGASVRLDWEGCVCC